MTVYYNENDPYAAAWLRNLVSAGLVPAGNVDERDIRDVRPDGLTGYVQCHFFAGIGGWPYALRLAGWPDEREVWTGSCPCQPFSVAGKRTGFADERHLWPVWRELIRERRPATVLGEQVAGAAPWLRLVRSDLEALGYAVGAMPVEAASAGADHLRDRFWFVARDERSAEGRRGIQRPGEGAETAHQRTSGELAGSGHGFVADSACEQVGAAGQPRQREHVAHANGSRGPVRDGFAGNDGQALGSVARQATEQAGNRCLLADANGSAVRHEPGRGDGPGGTGQGHHCDDSEWLVGTDGKARRVKPGVRLLAHGVPARVAKLRALGNAIDPRPAAAFIGAVMECRP
jgi:DNA (cytosine-5)-methyltransferase 1